MEVARFVPSATDERHHPIGEDPLWSESWYFDFHDAAGDLGGYVRISRYPNLGVVWYWGCLVGEGRPLVTVIDHEVPMPRDLSTLEVRSDGLWADHNVEEPLERWSLGLETTALAVDDPAEGYGAADGSARGEPTPLAFDLEWETDGEVFGYPPGLDRYEIPCRVHGTIDVGAETLELDGFGQRDHSWGPRDWWLFGWLWSAFRQADGVRWHAVTMLPHQLFTVGYRQPATDGAPVADIYQVGIDPQANQVPTPEAMPGPFDLELAGEQLRITPRHWAPIRLVAPDGRVSHFPRALCTVEGGTAPAVGWIELNRPDAA